MSNSPATFNVTFNDPAGTYTSYYAGIRSNIIAAGLEWNKYINGSGTFSVSVDFTLTGNAVATGGSEFISNGSGVIVGQSVVSNKLRTGIDQNGAGIDVMFNLNPSQLNDLWFDPDPSSRSIPVPIDKSDAVSTFIHEFGHAIGFLGFRNETNGTLTGSFLSTFDEKTSFDGTNFFFNGTRATAIYGGPVPLTFGNIFHVGNDTTSAARSLLGDVMAPVSTSRRNYVSELDLAILADCGLPTDASTLINANSVRNDFNGDSKSDVLWRDDFGNVAISQMYGANVTSNKFVTSLTSDWKIAGTGDFNGDKKSDIVWRNDNGAIALWQMNGNNVTSNKIVASLTSDWKISGTGDFNGDKKSDIVWRNDNGAVAMWQMNGSTVVSNKIVASLSSDWKTAGTGDFNGDGKTDLLWRNDNGAVALWQMDGSTVTSSKIVASLSSDWKAAGTGDFNGDGKTDIIWRNDNGAVALWQMDGSTVTSSKIVASLSSDWKAAGTGDFNGDKKSDLLWRNDNGAVALWQMNGSTVLNNSLINDGINQFLGNPDPTWKIAAPII
jgi:FG-GAP-like repeat